jgi:hypothetical protein
MRTPPMGKPTVRKVGKVWVVRAYNPRTAHVTAFRSRNETDARIHYALCGGGEWVVNINPIRRSAP